MRRTGQNEMRAPTLIRRVLAPLVSLLVIASIAWMVGACNQDMEQVPAADAGAHGNSDAGASVSDAGQTSVDAASSSDGAVPPMDGGYMDGGMDGGPMDGGYMDGGVPGDGGVSADGGITGDGGGVDAIGT
jgi:hypothetical protein